MRRRSLAIAFLLAGFLWAASALGQTAQVTGEVFYSRNRPATNLTVSVGGRFAFTDVKGRFRIANVPFGEHKLQVSRKGSKLKEIRVVIRQPTVWIPRIVL